MKAHYSYTEDNYSVVINTQDNTVTLQSGDNQSTLPVNAYNVYFPVPEFAAVNIRNNGFDPKNYCYFGAVIRVGALPMIKEYLADKKEQDKKDRTEKAARLESTIPGLAEVRAAIADNDRYREEFHRMMDDGDNDGCCPPAKAVDLDAVFDQYPLAHLYIKAEGYTYAAHYAKAAAGKKAVALLENGGSAEAAAAILDNWLPPESHWD